MTPLDVRARVATVTEAASILGLHPSAVRALVRDKTLRTVTLGARRRYIPKKALEQYAEEVAG